MLARNDLADYIADHYGTCDRAGDCYHGTDVRGRFNGCLRVGWRGRECPHWHPIDAKSWNEMRLACEVGRDQVRLTDAG